MQNQKTLWQKQDLAWVPLHIMLLVNPLPRANDCPGFDAVWNNIDGIR